MKKINLAVVGVTGLVGETLLPLLESRAFPLDNLHLLEDSASAGGRAEFGGRQLRVQPVDGFDFSQVALALFAGSAPSAEAHAPRAVAAGAVVVDASGAYRADETIPLVLAEVNPGTLAGRTAGIVAVPDPAAAALALVLRPLVESVGVAEAVVTVCQPVSSIGRRGVEALAGETAQLLNGRSVTAGAFPRQMAFNLLPLVGSLDRNGFGSEESAITAQLRRLLGDDAPVLASTVLQVPVFFGVSEAVQLRTVAPVTAAQVRALLAAAPGLELMDGEAPDAWPTPVSEAVGEDAVLVGRVRVDPADPHRLSLWLTADNLRTGAALSLVRLAEILVEQYL